MKKELRPYQVQAIKAVFDFFKKKRHGQPIVSAPTGSGKSLMIAKIIEKIKQSKSDARVLVLVHVKELVQQNHDEYIELTDDNNVGIYSASIKRRESDCLVTFASISSLARNPDAIGFYNVVIIDEVHKFPSRTDSIYYKVYDKIFENNEKVKVIGFSATPWRTSTGLMAEDDMSIFTEVVYDIDIGMLINLGYLCKPVTKMTDIQPDLEGIKRLSNDYNQTQLGERMIRDKHKVVSAVQKTFELGKNRNSFIFFCSNKDHAKLVESEIKKYECDVKTIFGSTKQELRDEVIAKFKDPDRIRPMALVNVDVLTTGFNAPNTDVVVLLRPTTSSILYIQMVGRGLRTFEGKDDCLVLDFANCIREHGPITAVRTPATKNGEPNKKPFRVCPFCFEVMALNEAVCPACKNKMPRPEKKDYEINHLPYPSELSLLDTKREVDVEKIMLSRHSKIGKPESLRVTYVTPDGEMFSEWLCVNHDGYAYNKAMEEIKKIFSEPDVRLAMSGKTICTCGICGYSGGSLDIDKDSWVCDDCGSILSMYSEGDPNAYVFNFIQLKDRVKKPQSIVVGNDGKWDRILQKNFSIDQILDGDDIPF